MKKLTLLLLSVVLLGSCTSTDDDSANDGKCWGAIRDYSPEGVLVDEVRFQYDCSECGKYVYWECPEPGTCGEYFNAMGTFECD